MHDYEDALREVLNRVYRNTDDCEMRISKDCYKLIKEALDKQIPEKPQYVDTRFRHHGRRISDGSSLDKCYKCPNCNSHIFHVFDSEKCCKYCGQALEWGGRKNDR